MLQQPKAGIKMWDLLEKIALIVSEIRDNEG